MKMVPPYIRDNAPSNAEKKMFNAFERLQMDGVVLHSLGLAAHRSKVYGEIDFVIICPEGILCLEIKGGAVFREEGVWHFVDRHGHENTNAEGPFNQVTGSMLSLRDYVKRNLGNSDAVSKCQYACGVIFPDQPFVQKGPDIMNEIVFDSRRTDDDLNQYIKDVFKYWRDKCQEKYGFQGDRLSKDNMKRAETYLRGNFKAIPTMNTILNDVDNIIVEATEEQFRVFEGFEENKRVVLKGGAGTGKTLLGLEHARRVSTKGLKVLMVCFNRLLSESISYNLKTKEIGAGDTIEVVHIHSYLKRLLPDVKVPEQGGKDFFERVLPEMFLDRMLEKPMSNEEKYDLVIIDEGQDILKIEYMMCLNEVLKEGLAGGSWIVFIDPNQNIYNKSYEEGIQELDKYKPAYFTLNTNCRNTRQIGLFNTLISGIKHEKYLRVNGEDVEEPEPYVDIEDQKRKLLQTVKRYKGQGIPPGDIVILSPYSFENSCLQGENIFKGVCSFQNITGVSMSSILPETLKFCTIQSFKGMEAKVLILVDVDQFSGGERKLLNYVAVSRARTLLHIFYPVSAKSEMEEAIRSGFLAAAAN